MPLCLMAGATAGDARNLMSALAASVVEYAKKTHGLGWSEKDAASSIEKALADDPEVEFRGNVAEILRTTLRWLGQDGARAGNRVGSRG